MLAEKPAIERSIDEVGHALGYGVSVADGGHIGKTLMLRYREDRSTDHVKIDCIYMNRSPLIISTLRSYAMRPDVEVSMFDDIELVEGKVKAFFDRMKVRDLYDISNLGRHFDDTDKHPALRGLMSDAEEFITCYIFPHTDAEAEYLQLFATGDFHPGLIFSDDVLAEAASKSPEALWKL